MMMRKLKKWIFPVFLTIVILFSPSCGSLDVDPDLPGPGDVLETPDQLLEASAMLYREWFNTVHALKGPALALATAADQLTTTEGTAAARDMAFEPRQKFNNDRTYSYMYVTENFWMKSYQVVLLANDILRSMEDKETILYEGKDIKPMLSAWAYFVRGVGYGYLGLLFDKANIVNIHADLPVEEFSDYHKVVDFAVASLDTAITLSSSHSFDLPDDFVNGVSMNAGYLRELASSYAARILVSYPRNDYDLNDVPWDKVLELAGNGIKEDFLPVTDNENWKDESRQYAISKQWGGVDLRIMNLMDPGFPARWPADNSSWDTPTGNAPDSSLLNSPDKRAVEYFVWSPPEELGTPYYLNTLYRIKRFDPWAPDASGPVPEFTVAENDLIAAEALAQLDNLAGAIQVINQGTRTGKGELPPLASDATEKEVLDAIFYERDVELMLTGTGLSFFDMRRRNMLQKGTPLHFPVPGKELELIGEKVYTFGGVANADGINTSNGGWEGNDER
jgi:hypothetical protein